jgi:hypothetical protein
MKVGDLVTFTDEGRYAKWFFGRMAIVKRVSINTKGEQHCRVKWLNSVKYHDRWTDFSDFNSNKFEVHNENE